MNHLILAILLYLSPAMLIAELRFKISIVNDSSFSVLIENTGTTEMQYFDSISESERGPKVPMYISAYFRTKETDPEIGPYNAWMATSNEIKVPVQLTPIAPHEKRRSVFSINKLIDGVELPEDKPYYIRITGMLFTDTKLVQNLKSETDWIPLARNKGQKERGNGVR